MKSDDTNSVKSLERRSAVRRTEVTRRSFPMAIFVLLLSAISPSIQAQDRMDVLFIAIDDLNDSITLLDDDAPIATPNLKRLAARGTLFTHAYCVSPACNPSRTAVMTGLRPSTTGVYGNSSDWQQAMPGVPTIPAHFRQAGYYVSGAGKIYHHHQGSAYHRDSDFDDFLKMPDPPDAPMPPKKLNGLEWFGSPNTDWGIWPPEDGMPVDQRTVDYCIERLNEDREQPLFLACGIFRPHMPFFAPQHAFDRYPLEQTRLPLLLKDDLDDIPPGGRQMVTRIERFWKGMMRAEDATAGTWRDAVRAYQACAGYADEQLGRLLDALDATGRADHTIIVLWSDHGYQLGEKDCWEKFTLWEKANHIPLIVVAPGVTEPATVCDQPVDLTVLFPTLIELCGLPSVENLDGASVVSLLRNPQADWMQPAVMTYLQGNHAVRSERWRYIRYADGTEELYDHSQDPLEWANLAGEAKYAEVLKQHRVYLPSQNAEPVPNRGR